MLHKTVEDQDHNSGLHSQVLINDSRLNIINVYQDSRLSIQDMSLPGLKTSVNEHFLFSKLKMKWTNDTRNIVVEHCDVLVCLVFGHVT